MLPEPAEWFSNALLEWSEDNLRDFPWRNPSLSFYEVFLAEFLLTQTPAENVARVHPEFVERFPDLDAIRAASEEEIAEVLEPVGFYNRRARALKEIGDTVEDLPHDRDDLLSLPRVGPYIADATLCFALNRPLPVIDRNVDRVYGRLFGDSWPDDEENRREFANRLLPEVDARRYNLALLDFGAEICKPKSPACEECFAQEYCAYYGSIAGSD